MNRIRRALELPLLTKELRELAARRRTYVVRVVYALALFVGSCLLMYSDVAGFYSHGLGSGRAMFERLVLFQFAGIVLFLPAMAAGAITSEKERDALGLIMLTTLSPWQILLQKWLSRLVPMISFLLLSFPLLAVAYSHGGVEDWHLLSGIVLLVLTCLQVGAVSLMCSAYFRATAEAFVASYVSIAVLYFIFPSFSGPHGFLALRQGNVMAVFATAAQILISTGLLLILARLFLVSRAFIPPRNAMLQLFRALDNFFNSANSLTGGVILVKDRNVSPGNRPIAWRETRKKSLGTFRYQFRVLALLELPILFACQLIRSSPQGRTTSSITMLLYLLWCVALGMIAVHAAGVISSERSRQTLDVLLTTPQTGHEIITQKFSGVRRLTIVLLVPFLSIYLFESWWSSDKPALYLFCSILLTVVYLPMAAWLSMWIGLRLRSHLRAIVASLLSIAALALLPVAGRELAGLRLIGASQYFIIISPIDVILMIETWGPELQRLWDPANPSRTVIYALAAHVVLFASLLWGVRQMCLHAIDVRLGRVGQNTQPTLAEEPVAVIRQEAVA